MSSAAPKPDISQIALKDLPEKPFFQEEEPSYRVIFSPEAYESVSKHARENTRVEICGVLVGAPARDKQGPFLEIIGAIRGEHADTKAGQVTFTHETWNHVQKVLDEEHPGRKIVGWYHSHPGYGLFLSSQDEFIHGQFFGLPWQVAFVTDPLADEDGFFVWQQGRPARMRQFWVGAEKKIPSAELASLRLRLNESMSELRDALPKTRGKGIRLVPFLVAILVLVLLSAAGLIQAQRYYRQLATLQEMSVKQNLLRPEPVDDLVRLMRRDKGLEGLEVRLIRLGPFVWAEGRVWTHAQKERAGRLLRSAEGIQSVDLNGLRVTHEYVTNPGESLIMIARRVYGDDSRWRDIHQANLDRVGDPGRLQPYLTLRLPE